LALHLGQGPAEGLAVSEEIAVVVDEDGDAELHFEERPQSHAVAERGEVGEVTSDDAVGVVGRTGEGEADGHGLLFERGYDLRESVDYGFETEIKIVGIGWQSDCLAYILAAAHGSENKVCATGVEGGYDTVVVTVHCYSKVYFKVFDCVSGVSDISNRSVPPEVMALWSRKLPPRLRPLRLAERI